MMTTLQEKLDKLGELMAASRIERELGIRIIERRNGDGAEEYLIEHLDEDGKVRAVAPAQPWAWKLQRCMYDLANELAGNVSELAGAYGRECARTKEAQASQAAAVAQARTDAYEDGFNAARVRLVKSLQEYRDGLEGRRTEARSGILSGSSQAALQEEVRKVDLLAVEMTTMNPHADA